MDNTESAFINNFGTSVVQIGTLVGYKPPNPIASLPNLQALLTQVLAARDVFRQKEETEEAARNAREELFRRAAPYASELINYCKSMGLDENALDNLYSFTREMRGGRAEEVPETPPGATPPKTISVAQTSYASVAEHFAGLVEAVRTIPNFSSDADKFKLTTLDAFVASLRQANTSVADADAETSTARRTLDELLYTGDACVIKSMNSAKPYIASIFGSDHPVYQTIVKFKFNKPKRLRS